MFISFTEAIIFRLVDDLKLWRLLCMGILLSDIAYCHSCAEAVGGWGEWVRLANWTMDDWIVTVTTWPFVFARLAIVFGIGLEQKERNERNNRNMRRLTFSTPGTSTLRPFLFLISCTSCPTFDVPSNGDPPGSTCQWSKTDCGKACPPVP